MKNQHFTVFEFKRILNTLGAYQFKFSLFPKGYKLIALNYQQNHVQYLSFKKNLNSYFLNNLDLELKQSERYSFFGLYGNL